MCVRGQLADRRRGFFEQPVPSSCPVWSRDAERLAQRVEACPEIRATSRAIRLHATIDVREEHRLQIRVDGLFSDPIHPPLEVVKPDPAAKDARRPLLVQTPMIAQHRKQQSPLLGDTRAAARLK